jgi:hypothetical protein
MEWKNSFEYENMLIMIEPRERGFFSEKAHEPAVVITLVSQHTGEIRQREYSLTDIARNLLVKAQRDFIREHEEEV